MQALLWLVVLRITSFVAGNGEKLVCVGSDLVA